MVPLSAVVDLKGAEVEVLSVGLDGGGVDVVDVGEVVVDVVLGAVLVVGEVEVVGEGVVVGVEAVKWESVDDVNEEESDEEGGEEGGEEEGGDDGGELAASVEVGDMTLWGRVKKVVVPQIAIIKLTGDQLRSAKTRKGYSPDAIILGRDMISYLTDSLLSPSM